ncbi:Heparinase II/III-like protein [Lachnospiraceae bacterium NK3A20]|nr:Heparinase II/III-like protein [Lachnospiraceae bacterium NK3A20]
MAKIHRTIVEDYINACSGEVLRAAAYTAMPDIAHRKASEEDPRPGWDELDAELRARLVAEGEKADGMDWPQLLASDYMEFSENGNRVHFEEKYFRRRRMLTALVMAECAEAKGRFTPKIIDGLYLILEETGWCLPAHNSYQRDGEHHILQDHVRPVIDLFAGETAAILGVAEYLLRPELCMVSPFISSYINEEIRRRIVTPYLSRHFWWMGGEGQMLNWTPWITQNVLLAVFTRQDGVVTADEKESILRQAALSVDYFLDEYGDDGCCSEGAQYFSHAGLCLFGCLHLMQQLVKCDGSARQDGKQDSTGVGSALRKQQAPPQSVRQPDVFSVPVVRNIASYIVNMYVGDQYYINFADCSPFPGRRSARDYLFARATGNRVMAAFAADDYRRQSWEERIAPEEENLWYHVLGAFAHGDMMTEAALQAAPEDVWYESNGLMIARAAGNGSRYCLAAKAGNNADSHNHNDVGSVILYKNECPYLIDLGVETYTAKTFSKNRYDIWTMQSQYHNLPGFIDISGSAHLVMQHDGEEYAAANVRCTLSDTECVLTEDIAPAYPDERVRHYVRTVRLGKTTCVNRDADAEGSVSAEAADCLPAPVVIEDHYDGDLRCVLSLMTYEEPRVRRAGHARHEADGDAASQKNDVCNPMVDQSEVDPAQCEGYKQSLAASGGQRFEISVGDLGTIRIDGAAKVDMQTCPITDPRLAIAWRHDCYRILVHMAGDTLRLAIE